VRDDPCLRVRRGRRQFANGTKLTLISPFQFRPIQGFNANRIYSKPAAIVDGLVIRMRAIDSFLARDGLDHR